MDAAVVNGLFALGGVALGSVPTFLDRWATRREKVGDRNHDARERRLAAFSDFIVAAEGAAVRARGLVNLGPKYRARVVGSDDRTLTPEELGAIAEVRRAAGRAVLLASTTTGDAIDEYVEALNQGFLQPFMFSEIESARASALAAMRAEQNG